MSIKEQVADFIVNARWETLPSPVQDQIRRCMVDDLGAALSGTSARVSQITADYAALTWPGDEATVLLQGKRAGAVGAAFARSSPPLWRWLNHATWMAPDYWPGWP